MRYALSAALVLGATLLAPRAAFALDFEPAEACSQLPDVVSARALAEPSNALPLDEGSNVPWCVSPDDPRCSPLPSGSLPMQVSAQPKLALATPTVPRPTYVLDAKPFPPLSAAGCLRPGDSERLERPPRTA